ncbi:hypothetical protein HDV01_006456 [Terramyces sp. JEL0728]|nr:hypothetical protein HDV01_006456 [Terramyces sp. JEL0728]
MEQFLKNRLDYSILQYKKDQEYLGPFLDPDFNFQDEFIELLDPIQTGPLIDIDINGLLNPVLVDCIAMEDPFDTWELKSSLDTLREQLIIEKRGQLVWELFQTEKNYIQQLMIIENVFFANVVQTNDAGESICECKNKQYNILRLIEWLNCTANLLKNTPEEHPDYFNLQLALQSVLDFVDSVNHNKKMEEENTKLLLILSKTSKCPQLSIENFISITDAVCAVSKRHLKLLLFADSLVLLLYEKKSKRSSMHIADMSFTFIRTLALLESSIVVDENTITFAIQEKSISGTNSVKKKAKLKQLLGADPFEPQTEVLDFLIAAEGWYSTDAMFTTGVPESVSNLGMDSFELLINDNLNDFVESFETAQISCGLRSQSIEE